MTTSSPATQPPRHEQHRSDRFIAYIVNLCDSTRARAELRRGLGLPVERCNYLHRYLVPWTHDREQPEKQMHPDEKRAHYAVAALIAARPRSARQAPPPEVVAGPARAERRLRANLGAALGHAVTQGVMKPNTAESTLHLMSRQTSTSLHAALPALIRQLNRGDVPVDWAVLLNDLAWFDRDRDRIATRWLEAYFRTVDTPAGTTDDHTPDGNSPEENKR
jgi:CRISPR system Cascade subunit CasB